MKRNKGKPVVKACLTWPSSGIPWAWFRMVSPQGFALDPYMICLPAQGPLPSFRSPRKRRPYVPFLLLEVRALAKTPIKPLAFLFQQA